MTEAQSPVKSHAFEAVQGDSAPNTSQSSQSDFDRLSNKDDFDEPIEAQRKKKETSAGKRNLSKQGQKYGQRQHIGEETGDPAEDGFAQLRAFNNSPIDQYGGADLVD